MLDISTNRKARKYSVRELVGRVLWAILSPAFHYSPRVCFGWRRLLLRLMGATVGQHVHVYPSCRIFCPWNLQIGDDSAVGDDVFIYNLGRVTIGERVTISHRAHLCAGTHDYSDPTLPLLKPPIVLGDEVWVCADAFVGPNVIIGNGAIVGARAVAIADVADWTIVVGNPAKFLKRRLLKQAKPSDVEPSITGGK